MPCRMQIIAAPATLSAGVVNRWDQEEDVPAFHDVTADPLPIVKPVALAGAVSVASFRVVHINIALVTALAPNVKYLRLVATDEKGNASPAVSLDGARMHSAAVAGRSVKCVRGPSP